MPSIRVVYLIAERAESTTHEILSPPSLGTLSVLQYCYRVCVKEGSNNVHVAALRLEALHDGQLQLRRRRGVEQQPPRQVPREARLEHVLVVDVAGW